MHLCLDESAICSVLLVPRQHCLQLRLTAPVGAALPGRAVPTLSSLLTFLGYSGSCQQAQPAENFAPCIVVASSLVGAFSQTAHSIYMSPLRLARGRRSLWSRPWSQCCMAWWAQDVPEGLAGLQVPTALCGFPALAQEHCALSCSPNNVAPCATLERFLQDHALAQTVCPALSVAYGAKHPKNIFKLTWHWLPLHERSVHRNIHLNLWGREGIVYTFAGPAQPRPGVMLDQAVQRLRLPKLITW